MPTRYRATLAYDGSAYSGFQRQADGTPTIQAAVEAAVLAVTGQAAAVTGAGRTDTGVHATGQVIAFDVDWGHDDAALLRALNATLPPDIALQDIAQRPGFHPRFDALSRVYRYTVITAEHRQPLLRLRAWHLRAMLDGDLMNRAGEILLGEHDFAAFGKPPQGENTVRVVVHSAWTPTTQPYGTAWTYTVEANAFLQHMVRRMVALQVDVGRGAMPLDEFEAAFRRAELIPVGLAPAHGLVLEQVKYPAG
jgi:tRNA pseudouridine38-40 synthase